MSREYPFKRAIDLFGAGGGREGEGQACRGGA